LNSLSEPENEDRNGPSGEEAVRWRNLFNYSYAESANLIKERRTIRNRVSDEHREIVQSNMEAQGYNREAYEYSLEIGGDRVSKNTPFREEIMMPSPTPAHASYIFKLEGHLDTLQEVQHAAGLNELPLEIQGIGVDGDANFCRVNGDSKQAITRWISTQQMKFKPTFVQVSQAEKDLPRDSMYPTLGLDMSLPENRPVSSSTGFYPAQNQYPVWYFFYGTLTDSTILSHQLSLPED
jgi:hypothetical protein